MEAAGGTTTDTHVEEAMAPEDPVEETLRSSGSAMEIEGGGLVLNAQKKKKKAAAVRITPAQNQFLREAFEKEGGQAAVTTPMGKCAMITGSIRYWCCTARRRLPYSRSYLPCSWAYRFRVPRAHTCQP